MERLEERIYTVEVNEACYEGEKEEYVYRAEPNTVNIRVKALEEELDSLSFDTEDLEIDVSSMTEGFHEADIRIKKELDHEAYEVVGISSCIIHVTKMPDGPGALATGEDSDSSAEMPSGTESDAEDHTLAPAESSVPAPAGQ